ncbi:MAG: diaminopimelate epimerase [Oligoflexia bacterium]|nr:diaminopimelate epimerase [Oligoflexia bacterium]
MVKLEFLKISAAGNDFIVFDNRKKIFNTDHQEDLVELMCARRYGIGADGVCFVELSDVADYRTRIFSGDGNELDFSSNGVRASIRFANEKEVAGNTQKIETLSGVVDGEVDDELVGVSVPGLKKADLRCELEIPHHFDNKVIELAYIDTGFTHLVLKVGKVAAFDVKGFGYMLSNHTRFQPKGIDVTFYDVIDPHNMNVITFEAGVNGLVNSSGNGIVAAHLVAQKRQETEGAVIAHSWGGLLKVFDKNGSVNVEGEARVAYSGHITSEMMSFDIEKVRKRQLI